MVPVFVTTGGKDGQVVFGLRAEDFLLTDNGVSQNLTLESETDAEPLALAIVVETGGAGGQHLSDYQELDAILDALIGNVEHRVAVVGFDSAPHLLLPFTSRMPRKHRANWLRFPKAIKARGESSGQRWQFAVAAILANAIARWYRRAILLPQRKPSDQGK
jgi:hypothetical protein